VNTQDEDAEAVKELVEELLKLLHKREVPSHVAQAALGNAWIRACLTIGVCPEHYEAMVKDSVSWYKRAFESIEKQES
jgi:uncharacterized protein YejL (UPF0352 family)